MALDNTLPLWGYSPGGGGTINFNRVNPNGMMWFNEEAVANTEGILDSTQFYVDIGGLSIPAFAISGSFENDAQRDLMLSKVRTRGTLTNGRGRSRTVLVFNVVPTFIVGAISTADIVFSVA